MNQKKHLNAIAALEASKDAEPGSKWNSKYCCSHGFIECRDCYAYTLIEGGMLACVGKCLPVSEVRAALQSGLDAYNKRKAEKEERRAAEAANSPDSQTIVILHDPDAETKPIIPDPPDTPEVRAAMMELQDISTKGPCHGINAGCPSCPFRPCKKENNDKIAAFAISWLSRHPAVWPMTIDSSRQFAEEARRQGWKR
jgi:hypothetical protein